MLSFSFRTVRRNASLVNTSAEPKSKSEKEARSKSEEWIKDVHRMKAERKTTEKYAERETEKDKPGDKRETYTQREFS